MPGKFSPPGYRPLTALPSIPVRVGIYTGICLSVVFISWVFIANRIPVLEPLAMQRNILASFFLFVLASMPVLRFLRSSGDLLRSGLVAWSLLTLTYRILGVIFIHLEDTYSTFHVFVVGAVTYLVLATLSWIGMIVWRAKQSQSAQTPH